MLVIGYRRIMAVLMAIGIFFAVEALAIGSAQAAGDVKSGKKVFNKCKACHTLKPGKHRIGPSLAGIIGRKAGTSPKYRYSKAMRAYGASGVLWNGKTLDVYLTKPRKVVKGTKMTFPGLKKAKQRADLIAYLMSVANPAK